MITAVLLVLWLYAVLRGRVETLARDANAPYGRFALAFRELVSGTVAALRDSVEIRRQNAALASELDELRARLIFHDETERENTALKKALKLQTANPSFLCADVVSRGGASGWWNVVRISKGARDGVSRNCAVISTEGLVGRVVATSADTADILLLTDVNSKVSCCLEGAASGARGILTGGGIFRPGDEMALMHVIEPMSLAYLDKEMDIAKGARVVTSGLGGVYPSGIPVGEVVSSVHDSTKLYQSANVAPYVDFASLRRVFVILRSPAIAGEEDAGL